jgi:hypothetical protein
METGEKNRNEIYELRREQSRTSKSPTDLMTEEEVKRGEYYRQKYDQRRGEIEQYREEFDDLLKAYACERDKVPDDPNYPNNFISLITPVVEGQVAAMLENDIDYNYTSNNPYHKKFIPQLESAAAYCRQWNKANQHFKDYARMYDLLGNAWVTVVWEKSISNATNRPSGYPRIMIPSIMDIFVDGSIKDYKDLQHARYIIHRIGFVDIAWARDEYGDEKANALAACFQSYETDGTISIDDLDTFELLHVWTRDNPQKNLQLIEMDATGFILRESDPETPYYETVDNEYPFYFGRMIPRQGQFYGYGDGKILSYLQKYTNNLADELELAAMYSAQGKTYIDKKSDIDLDELDSDPSKPVICENPRQNVYVAPAAGINPVIHQALSFNLEQAQRMTRFSDIMTGSQQGVSATATQINGQLSQGAVGIKDKASDIQAAMAWCDRYCLRLCLDKWDVPFWVQKFRTVGDEENFEFLDVQEFAQLPAVEPADGATLRRRREAKEQDPSMKVIPYDGAKDDNGDAVFFNFDFDVTVKLAAGFPKGKVEQFNQIVSVSQIVLLNTVTGKQEPMIEPEIARAKLEELMGFKFTSEKENEVPDDRLLTTPSINPIGESGEVTMPQGSQVQSMPSNLANTVPKAADNRAMSM